MKSNAGFLISKIKQLGDRVFEKVLDRKNIDAFNGAQGRILYVLWQEDGVPIKAISDRCGLAITSLTTMLERMEKSGLVHRIHDQGDRRQTLVYLTERALDLKSEYDSVSDHMGNIYFKDFSQKDIKIFETYLNRILKNLEEWKEE